MAEQARPADARKDRARLIAGVRLATILEMTEPHVTQPIQAFEKVRAAHTLRIAPYLLVVSAIALTASLWWARMSFGYLLYSAMMGAAMSVLLIVGWRRHSPALAGSVSLVFLLSWLMGKDFFLDPHHYLAEVQGVLVSLLTYFLPVLFLRSYIRRICEISSRSPDTVPQ